jgi:cysteine desulfurase
MMEHIYLDNAATTPILPEVIACMNEAMQEIFGNPSAINYHGRQAKQVLERCRQVMADSLNAKSASEIIFTSGGTESDNTAIIQSALTRQNEGKHIITTVIEHEAVLRSMQYLQKLGFEITYLSVDENGQISLQELKEALRPDTILVSIMAGNNEVASYLPLEQIGQIVKQTNAWFHTDAVQAYGITAIDVQKYQIDLLSVSAHKLGGPKFIGFLYQRTGIDFGAYLKGGSQETNRRAGTQNVPAIAGFAKAVEIAQQTLEQKQASYYELKNYLLTSLTNAQINFEVNGVHGKDELAHIVNIWFKGCLNSLLLTNLDLAGISVSAGSACTAGSLEPSHVLAAMYGEHPRVQESLRFSFGPTTTKKDIDLTVQALVKIIKRIK